MHKHSAVAIKKVISGVETIETKAREILEPETSRANDILFMGVVATLELQLLAVYTYPLFGISRFRKAPFTAGGGY